MQRGNWMKVLKGILALLFSAGFIWFLIPAFVRVVNIGNVLGMAVCAFLLLWLCAFPRLRALAQRRGRLRPFLFANRALAVLFLAGFAWAAVLTGLMAGAAFSAPKGTETAVVLGSQVRGTEPSLDLWARIDAAGEWLSKNPDAACVASGGQGEGELVSEASVIRDKLVEKGIAPERIYVEDTSGSTAENLANTRKILEEHRLGTSVAIVTDEYHQFRAGLVAKKMGLSPSAVCARTPWHILSACYMRELLAITAQLVL